MASQPLLLIFRHAPYGQGLARAGYDVALAAAAFDQQVSLLFMDDGVWQLLPGQQPESIDAKNIARSLDALPLYDVERLYADTGSLDARGLHLQDLRPGVEALAADELATFIDGFGRILSF